MPFVPAARIGILLLFCIMSFHIVLYWKSDRKIAFRKGSGNNPSSVSWEGPLNGVYLAGGNAGTEYELLHKSQTACLETTDCHGVTRVVTPQHSFKWQLRIGRGLYLKESPSNEVSYSLHALCSNRQEVGCLAAPEASEMLLAPAHSIERGGVEIHFPSWAFNQTFMSSLQSVRSCDSSNRKAELLSPVSNVASKSQDGEDKRAQSTYFHGCSGGIYLEMGALDGIFFSNTYTFEKDFGWKGVLVEADPAHYRRLVEHRPQNILINAAVCDTKRVVHWIHSGDVTVRGIKEFMHPEFLSLHHPEDLVETEIMCLPLSDIFEIIRLNHFDFFSLDLEGAELAAIESIDFDRASFTVVVVEADGVNATKDQIVADKLVKHGYRKDFFDGRNLWHVRSQTRVGQN